MSPSTKILLVEDNPDHAELAIRVLGNSFPDAEIMLAESGEDGISLLSKQSFDLLILDHSLPHLTGLEVLKQVRSKSKLIPIIFVTGHGGEEVAVEAMKEGAQDYIPKSKGYLHILAEAVERVLKANLDSVARDSDEAFLEIIESSSDAIYMQDLMGRIIFINTEAERLTGYDRAELLGKHFSYLLSKSDNQTLRSIFKRWSRSTEPFFEINIRRKTGEEIPVEIQYTAMRSNDRVVGYQGVARVSAKLGLGQETPFGRKGRLQRDFSELPRGTEDLQLPAKLHYDILYELSHTFRTPLSGILGYCEILESEIYGALSAQQIDAIKKISACGKELMELADEFMQIPQFLASFEPLHREHIAPLSLLEDSVTEFLTQTTRKGLDVEIINGEDLPLVLVDSFHMRRVLIHLLQLLFDDSEKGKVLITLEQRGEKLCLLLKPRSDQMPVPLQNLYYSIKHPEKPKSVPAKIQLSWRFAALMTEMNKGTLNLEKNANKRLHINLCMPVAEVAQKIALRK